MVNNNTVLQTILIPVQLLNSVVVLEFTKKSFKTGIKRLLGNLS